MVESVYFSVRKTSSVMAPAVRSLAAAGDDVVGV